MIHPTFYSIVNNLSSYFFYKETELLNYISRNFGYTTHHLELILSMIGILYIAVTLLSWISLFFSGGRVVSCGGYPLSEKCGTSGTLGNIGLAGVQPQPGSNSHSKSL